MPETIFYLPDLGEGLTEAKVVEWHARPGDTLRADDLMISMETAKAIVDVPSPYHATLSACFASPGDMVKTGSPLVKLFLKEKVDTATIAGQLPTAMHEASEMPLKVDDVPGFAHQQDQSFSGKIAPYLRQLAHRHNIDLSSITPTGYQGVMTTSDIEKAMRAQKQSVGFEPLDNLREAMAMNMAKAHAAVVNTTIFDTAMLRWTEKQDMTVRCLQAWAHALKQAPSLNAWYDHETLSRRLIETVDVALAMDTQAGLLAPVICDVANQTSQQLRATLNQMKSQAHQRAFRPNQLTGGSVLLSNFGSIAGQWATPQVLPPMVAILGLGRQVEGALPVSLSFDHRAVTGGEAARALKAFISHIQWPSISEVLASEAKLEA